MADSATAFGVQPGAGSTPAGDGFNAADYDFDGSLGAPEGAAAGDGTTAGTPTEAAGNPPTESTATTPATPETTATTPTPEADALPAELVQQAVAAGFTAAELEGLDPAAVRSQITALDRRVLALGQAAGGAPAQQQPGQQPPATQQPPQQPAAPAAWAAALQKLKTAGFDPDLVGALEVLGQQAAQSPAAPEVQELRQQLQELRAREQERERDVFFGEFEGWLAQLDPAFDDVLGRQPVASLPPGSPLLAQRQQLLVQAVALRQALASQGLAPPRGQELFDRALRLVHGDKLLAAERAKLSGQLQRRRGQHLGRPGGHKPRPQSAEEAAQEHIGSILGQAGRDTADELALGDL